MNFYALAPLGLVISLALAGCHPGGAAAGGPPPGGARPPADVDVVTLKEEPVTLTTELPGRTSAYRIAVVRPQVNGVLQKRLFVEGSDVKEGQQLYQIDPAPYQAALDTALANLQKAQAAETTADITLKRNQGLLASHAVSQQDIDNANATYEELI
jgi:membrane fusion protein (multidrug efflux system)